MIMQCNAQKKAFPPLGGLFQCVHPPKICSWKHQRCHRGFCCPLSFFFILFSEQCSPLLSGHHYHYYFSGLGHLPVSAVSLGGKGARARLGPAKLSIKTHREPDKSFQETKQHRGLKQLSRSTMGPPAYSRSLTSQPYPARGGRRDRRESRDAPALSLPNFSDLTNTFEVKRIQIQNKYSRGSIESSSQGQ